MATDERAKGVHDVLEQVEQHAAAPRISVGTVMDSLGHRAYGSVYVILALITLTPIGAIPGFSIPTGAILVLLALQQIIGRTHPWLPQRLLNASVETGKFDRSVARLEPFASRIDRVIRPRLTVFLTRPFRLAAAFVVVCLGLAMFPLEVIPFGVDAPALALLLIGIGLSAGDGLFVLLGMVLAPATGWLLFATLLG